MSKYLHYTPSFAAQPVGVQMAQPPAPPQVQGAGAKIIQTALGAGSEALKIVARDYNRYQNCRVDDLVQQTDKRFEEWKAAWTKQNQGANATEAQRAFAAKYEELSKEALEEFGGSGHEIYPHELEKKLMARGLMAFKDGGDYQQQQTKLWEKSVWEGKLAAFEQACANYAGDPERLAYMRQEVLDYWKKQNPGSDPSATAAQLQEKETVTRVTAFMAAKNWQAAEATLNAGGVLGSATASEESGRDGILAIGYDANGGTSYGKHQLSSRQGSYQEWIKGELAQSGEQGAALAKQLLAGGAMNTGSTKGAHVELYKKLAAENPELFEKTQHAYLMRSHYNPALKNSPAGFRELVEKDRGLQEMVFSTAVQHGGGGAAKIFREVWQDGMSRDQLIDAVYNKRGGLFASSNGQIQKSVKERFGREREVIRRHAAGLDPAKAYQLQHQIDTAKKAEAKEQNRLAINSFMAQTADLPLRERLAQAHTVFGANREIYNSVQKGILADDAARERIRKAEERTWMLTAYAALEKAAALPEAQSWEATQAIISQAPPDKREALYKAANNFRNPGAKDDPIAVDEITERLGKGEDVNIVAEYGDRLSRKTAQRLSDKVFRERLPEIRTAFNNAALEWLGDISNKNHAKSFGYGSPTALWTKFLDSTDADEKKDAKRLRQEADEFFKGVVLDPGWFRRDIHTIAGLQKNVASANENALPGKNTAAYKKVEELLRQDDPNAISFEHDQLIDMYHSLIGYKKRDKN